MIIRNYFPKSDADHQLLLPFCPLKESSAEQALKMFEKFINQIKFEYDREGSKPIRLKVVDVQDQILEKKLEIKENISRVEQEHGLQFPKVFSDFILKIGLITIWRAKQVNDEGDIDIHRRIPLFAFYNNQDDTELFPNVLDLPRAIANNFTNHFLESSYSVDKIEFLRSNYFVFGQYNYNDQEYDYWFFTKDGRFGSFNFQDENYPKNIEVLDTLIDGSIQFETFDHLISRFISKAIIDFSVFLADY